MKQLKITCYGEVLWDVFPTHKKIGGAPLNVALRLKSLSNDVSIISKVGNDDLGASLLQFIEELGVNTSNIQIDSELQTGKVKVTIDEKGSASYDIMFPRAWDAIATTNQDKELVSSSDAFIFGSLIGRNAISRNSLMSLLKLARYKVFDVNLRAPYYTNELLIELMYKADFIKFNDDELLEICNHLGSKFDSIEQNIAFISDYTNTKHICVTKGENGAVLLYDSTLYYNNGYRVNVIDTVGAGDSFLATIVNYLLKKEPTQKAIDIACAVGALVAQSEGANPEITFNNIDDFMSSKR